MTQQNTDSFQANMKRAEEAFATEIDTWQQDRQKSKEPTERGPGNPRIATRRLKRRYRQADAEMAKRYTGSDPLHLQRLICVYLGDHCRHISGYYEDGQASNLAWQWAGKFVKLFSCFPARHRRGALELFATFLSGRTTYLMKLSPIPDVQEMNQRIATMEQTMLDYREKFQGKPQADELLLNEFRNYSTR